MSAAMEGPRRYYDFNYLLKPTPPLSKEETKSLMVDLLQSGKEGVDATIGCLVNSFAIMGDIEYTKNAVFKPLVGTEKNMASAAKELEALGNVLEIVAASVKRLEPFPQCGIVYHKLWDFEMWLLQEKRKKRLTSKRD